MFDLGPSFVPLPPELTDATVRLRPPRYADFKAWRDVRENSRAFLEPWEPSWEVDMLTRAGYRKRVRLMAQDWRDDRGYAFHIFENATQALVGGINLTGVRRRAAQYASLGYWMGSDQAGRGLMSAALRVLLPAAFQKFGLHRVEAACIPENEPQPRAAQQVRLPHHRPRAQLSAYRRPLARSYPARSGIERPVHLTRHARRAGP